jgi:hypothetical protein
MMKRMKFFIVTALMLLTFSGASAQCTFRNTAFKSGEYLTYNLYYNWKFVWVKAGTASMSTVQSRFQGHPAYRVSLTTRGNNKVDQMFVLRDTLLCYSSLNMAPLYFRKGAREGKRYYVDEVYYTYPNGNCHIDQHELKASGESRWHKNTYQDCVYDMLNIFCRARSFNPTGWIKGHVVKFPIVDGNSRTPAQLRFRGIVSVKADNGHKYRCLQISYMEYEGGSYKRIVDFYITDDDNHIPVRLDMFLKFGTAKAFLVGSQGLKNEVTSLLK